MLIAYFSSISFVLTAWLVKTFVCINPGPDFHLLRKMKFEALYKRNLGKK